jgi:superfamily I DNA and/or RNA helicase
MDNIQVKTLNLFKYIKSVLELSFKVQTDFSKISFKKFENTFQNTKYISSIFTNPEQEDYFVIEYPDILPPPKHPRMLSGFIIDYPDSPQLIKEENPDNDNAITQNNNNREKIWKEFLPKLQAWKKENQERLSVEKLFNDLYNLSMHRDENYEFILGHGIIAWKISEQMALNYPLVSIELNVGYDSQSKTIRINAVDGKNFVLEDLVIQNYVTDILGVKNLFDSFDYDIAEKSSYIDFFRRIVNMFKDPTNENIVNAKLVEDKQIDPCEINHDLKLIDTWGIFYRKRRQSAEIKDSENYIEQFEGDDKSNIGALKTFLQKASNTVNNFYPKSYTEIEVLQNDKILFPLPFNDEQINILTKLEVSDSVIVQGPPGTGKSHTIANLISHFLAMGDRVLVTSQKDQALDVLLTKIPEELRNFCVPILPSIPDAKEKMDRVFREITEAINYPLHTLIREIKDLDCEINDTKDKLIETQDNIKKASKGQLTKIKLNDGNYLPMIVAQKLKDETDKHSWLKDKVMYDVEYVKDNMGDDVSVITPILPLDKSELERLSDLSEQLRDYLDDLKIKRPQIKSLITPKEFEELSNNLLKIRDLDSQLNSFSPDLVIKSSKIENLTSFAALLRDKLDNDKSIVLEWQKKLLKVINDKREQKRLQGIFSKLLEQKDKLEELRDKYNIFKEVIIKTPFTALELKEFLFKQLEKVKDNKNIYSFFNKIFMSKQGKMTLNNISIDGVKELETESDWLQIIDYVEMLEQLNNLCTTWNKIANKYSLPIINTINTPNIDNDKFREFEDSCEEILSSISYMEAVLRNEKINEEIKTFSGNILKRADYILTICHIESILQAVDCKLELMSSKSQNIKVKEKELKNAISQYLNDYKENLQIFNSISVIYDNREKAILDYTSAYNKLKDLELLEDKYKEFSDLFNKFKDKAHMWAEFFMQNLSSGIAYPEYWAETFQYKAWMSYVSKINELARSLTRLEKEFISLNKKLRKLKEQLILKTAFMNIKKSATQANATALEEWKMALKRLPKGKSKHAPEKRRLLQAATQRAKNAIPVWIMQLQKVSETIPSEVGIFDVVIIDEASQSDIRAFLALIRGKKVIVVGDPEQVSPLNIGVDVTQIQNKIKEYLSDIPSGDYYDLKTSIYDIAKLTLGSNSELMLKEHFRCLPEIIKFSNDLCYGGKIIPLRYENSNKKLTPVLETVYTQTGIRRDDSDINEMEAETICLKVKDIIKNELFDNKTIGIISLTGSEQAECIENILTNCISTDERAKYKIRAGNAAAFQGDERDIIFLSMVVGPNDNKQYKALTADMYKQRFNVAVSRARDKIILVHSLKLDEIANHNCMRYKLLEFMANVHLTEKIEKDRLTFESDFEETIYNIFADKGYAVSSQVRIGPYKIDLVVEGTDAKLGIECDGDKYRPPEEWFQDSLKQKNLERMGWNIYRIWGSNFYNDKQTIVEEITVNLNKLGIYPVGKI